MNNTMKRKSVMKRILAFLLAIVMVLSFAGCSDNGGKNKLIGTWDVDSAEIDGSKFTPSELEAMGDDSLVGIQIVIKEGGKACLVEDGSGEVVDWKETENGIKIGEQECSIVDGMICLDFDDAKLYFKKTSDSQTVNMESAEETTDNETEINLKETESTTETKDDKKEVEAGSVEELTGIVEKDVEDTVSALTSEFEQLQTDIDTYEKYKQNIDKVEAFYTKAYTTQQALNIRLREYAIEYAEKILASDNDNDDKYEEMEVIYDVIYDSAGDDIYDEIYDGVLDEIYDVFYDGVLDDAYDVAPYEEWSDARSNEYEWWSDTRSDVYEDWSDTRSDVYDFWSDVKSEIWDDDIEKAKEKITDFQDDISKLKSN